MIKTSQTQQNFRQAKALSLMVKPASCRCNMACSYCFYRAEAASRAVPDRGLISKESAEILIRRLSDYLSKGDVLEIGFQGGEPTLISADFYESFANRLEESCPAEIHWYFQTNGLMLSEDFFSFFKKHKVLVGLSLDMEESTHDSFRKDVQGSGSWKRVMETKKKLDQACIPYNILAVLTPAMAKHPDRVWNFIRRRDLRYVQFLPCINPLPLTPGPSVQKPAFNEYLLQENSPSANTAPGKDAARMTKLTPELFASFYQVLSARWLEALKGGEYYSIKLFDDLIHLLQGEGIHACGLNGTCEPQLILEADLSAFPCDFACTDPWLLGNLKESSIEELLERQLSFRHRERVLPALCASCPYRRFCGGGCPALFEASCISAQKKAHDAASFCGYRELLSCFIPAAKAAGLLTITKNNRNGW